MGELRRHADRRRSFPSCFERTDVGGGCSWNLEQPASATLAKSSTKKTRWSLGGGTVGGRGVPDIVRVTRYDDDDHHHHIASRSRRVDDSRKRSRRDQLSDLPDVPAKRVWPVSRHGASCSSMWDCAGLTWPWSGLRRRLSVLRRSSRAPRVPPPPSCRRDRQPPASIGKISL